MQAADDAFVATHFHALQEEQQPNEGRNCPADHLYPVSAQQPSCQDARQHKGNNYEHTLILGGKDTSFVSILRIFVPMLLPYCHKDIVEAGCDEAGRGCLAGAVYAAAVILPPDFRNEQLNDSKQLTDRQRRALRTVIERESVAWAVGVVSPEEIDRFNILNASILAMHRAVDALRVRPQHLLIDGNRFRSYPDIPHTTVVKGDGKYLSIAAASILAKTCRDDYMLRLHADYPVYGWDRNKGYPTPTHRAVIRACGETPYHRHSFNLLGDTQLELNFGE